MNTKICLDSVLRCLPPKIARAVLKYEVEEILIIAGQPVMLYMGGDGFFISSASEITTVRSSCLSVGKKELEDVFTRACENSVYAVENELKNGYITLEGGHRIGICGSGVIKNGRLGYIKNISAINIRIARQIIGKGEEILPAVHDKYFHNSLVISPPGCGKTTLLRDLTRILGEKYKVGVADERGEIAAVYNGMAQNDVGIKTVVMDSVPKAQAINMMIRSMGVEIIVTDEIGSDEDVRAIKNALYSGVKVLASAHGYSYKDVLARPNIKTLAGADGFEKFIVLSRRFGVGTVEEVACSDF